MGILSFARDDRVILAGLGLAAIGVVTMMRFILEQYRDASEIKPIQPKTQYITQETEDSLKLDTLDSLLGHYNFAIRETAAKIVWDRAVNDGTTVNELLWGITQPDYDERMKNLRALAIITDQRKNTGYPLPGTITRTCLMAPTDTLHLLNTPKAYSAFVRSLELCVGDVEHEKLDDKYFDEYYFRDMAERMCLVFVLQLINKYDVRELIRAKFVEKWLARQRWGDSDEERQRNFEMYMKRRPNRIPEICNRVQETRLGSQALKRAKLVPEQPASRDDESTQFGPVLSNNENDAANNSQDESRPTEGSQARILEQSAEEQRLRRQHRQAMVLNDGTHPFGRDDIFEPGRD